MDPWLRALLYLPDAASDQAVAIDRLHAIVITTTMIGAGAVLLTALALVVRFRRRGGAVATPTVRPSLRFELGHSLGLLALFFVFWSIGFVQYAEMQEPVADALEVRVVGKQWMWSFAPEVGPRTIGYVVVPEDRPVRLTLTSRDVIHSLYVPALRLKRDAVPGRFTSMGFEARRPGVFPIFCAEFCGTSHSRMAADLVVLGAREFEAYVRGAIPPFVGQAILRASAQGIEDVPTVAPRTRIAQGRAVAREHACFTCHTLDGRAAVGPTWRGLFGSMQRLEGGRSVLVDESYVRRSIVDPRAEVAAGFRSVMPTGYDRELDGDELDALVAFIRSLGGRGAPARSLGQ